MDYRPSVTVKFDKVYYYEKDTIKIFLSPIKEVRDSLYVEITATLLVGKRKLDKVQLTTNSDGEAVVCFLPQKMGERLSVIMDLKYNDWEESLTMPVIYRNNPIQFTTFPEGGNLVSGIESKVAFKAVKSNGEPIDVTGAVFEDDKPILDFKSLHAGMGSFNFIPQSGRKYLIRLSEPFIDSTYLLPKVYPAGMVMHLVERDKESLTIEVAQNGDIEQEDIYLRVQCRGVVCGIIKGKLSRNLRIKIPLKDLPMGIAEITLFNNNLVPIAERLVYVNPDRKLNITTELSKKIYPTRGKVNLKITVKDENGKPVIANLGVSVFDKLYQNTDDSVNIINHYFLSTQLKGSLYDPSYYFNYGNKERYEALDLLMLTQGWRRYIWSERELARYNHPPLQVIFDATRGNIVVPSVWKNVRQEQKSVIAFSPEIDSNKIFIITEPSGSFTIDPDLLKSWKGDYIYLKPLGPLKTSPRIKLIDPFDDINMTMNNKNIIWPIQKISNSFAEASGRFETSSGMTMIDEIIIRSDNTNIIRGKSLGMLDSLTRIKSGDYVCKKNVLNCRVHSRYEEGTTLPVIGKTYQIYVYDEELGWGLGEIKYKGPEQNMSEDVLLKMNNLARIKGYYGQREFYQPNYDQGTEENMLPDFRNTILWEPNVITDKNGEATLSFFCSDINTDFVGRIEGVSNDGLLGSESFKFTVRKLNVTP
jgi:hypothetical protein